MKLDEVCGELFWDCFFSWVHPVKPTFLCHVCARVSEFSLAWCQWRRGEARALPSVPSLWLPATPVSGVWPLCIVSVDRETTVQQWRF